MAEVLDYAPDLRAITGGRGDYTMEFERYEEVPGQIAQKVIAEAAERRGEGRLDAPPAPRQAPARVPFGRVATLRPWRSIPSLRRLLANDPQGRAGARVRDARRASGFGVCVLCRSRAEASGWIPAEQYGTIAQRAPEPRPPGAGAAKAACGRAASRARAAARARPPGGASPTSAAASRRRGGASRSRAEPAEPEPSRRRRDPPERREAPARHERRPRPPGREPAAPPGAAAQRGASPRRRPPGSRRRSRAGARRRSCAARSSASTPARSRARSPG